MILRSSGLNALLSCKYSRIGIDVPSPAFGPRMVCTGCGMIGADARPNWRERYDPGQMTRGQ